ncbi:MAG: alcohol dehydrogenase catalytic domain-containing protein [bacterium]|nr:alcohol dehydrogenase catalytic domain-containing protein [bacterium]
MRVIAYYGRHDLREEEWPRPLPGRGEVRVRIQSVCICGSDITQYTTGKIGDVATPVPFVLGHEAAGIVDACGEGVNGLPQGTPVALEPNMPCGECEWCERGKLNLCPHVKFLGSAPVHGALAEYVVVPARHVVPVRARVTFAEMACIEPLAIGIYVVRKLGVGAGDTVAVFGVGGIGMVCVLAARASGARVVAVTDRVGSRLALAKQLGAERGVNVSERDAVREIMQLTGGRGVDVAIEAAGVPGALRDAVLSAAIGGRVAIAGIPHEESWELPAAVARRRELLIHNIRRCCHTTHAAVEWVERGVVNLAPLVTHRMPWEKAEDAFELAAARAEGTLRISLEPELPREPFYA